MNILHINTYDNVGGAARAAFRLHMGLRNIGQNSKVFVSEKKSNDPTVMAFIPPPGFSYRLRRSLRHKGIVRSFRHYRKTRPAGYDLFSDDRTEHGSELLKQLPSCDVINFHWVSGFIDYQAFFAQIPKHVPIVWTLHDLNAFTGGCHFDIGCEKYLNKCGACPQLGSNDQKDLSNQIWKRKQEVFEKVNHNQFHIVTPSRWLARQAKRSSLFNRFSISVIPSSLNIEDFSARDKQLAKEILGAPPNAKVVLFMADYTTSRRKGLSLLNDAFKDLDNHDDFFLISIGHRNPVVNSQINHIHLDYIDNDRLLSLFYSAADLFVIPSLQDNLPNTVLESLSCGTPIVGFDIGGIPDMVRPGITGELVPPQDVNALRIAITQLLGHSDKLKEMSDNCRRIAVEEYSLIIQARRYVELYKKILNSAHE